MTGKSSQSDLVTGKMTLPVVYGLSKNANFAKRWKLGPIQAEEVVDVIKLLENDGGKDYTQAQASKLLNDALLELEKAHPTGIDAEALKNLATSLVNRQS